MDDASVLFLEDGAQPASVVADALCAFLAQAQRSLDIAIYDSALTGSLAAQVGSALQQAAGRSVSVRIGYYAGPHASPTVKPPLGSSLAFLQPLGLPIRPITGFRGLMHDKYVIRDAGSDQAAVWTGSTNWTGDAWSREENIILRIPSPDLANRYVRDFEEMWDSGTVENSGDQAGGDATVGYAGRQVPAHVWFSPATGPEMAHAVGDALRAAQTRIVVASPVISDGSILGALRDVTREGRIPIRGIFDKTQMDEALQQWGAEPEGSWKPDAFHSVVGGGTFAGKRSTPFAPGSVHDYMHVKIVVVDDLVFTGSYNFSHSGEENAENLLRIESAALADTCVTYIERLIQRYASQPTPSSRS